MALTAYSKDATTGVGCVGDGKVVADVVGDFHQKYHACRANALAYVPKGKSWSVCLVVDGKPTTLSSGTAVDDVALSLSAKLMSGIKAPAEIVEVIK